MHRRQYRQVARAIAPDNAKDGYRRGRSVVKTQTTKSPTLAHYGARKIAKLPYHRCVLAGDQNRVTTFAFLPN
jgi:hypothetical protein